MKLNRSDKARRLGVYSVTLWFGVGGIGHFAATGFFASIVPPYLPHPYALVYVSGVFELLGVIGLLIPQTRRAAGIGLFLLTIAVTPANVQMWLHPQRYPVAPQWVYLLRLFIQIGLLACIWWSTQPPRQPAVIDRSEAPTSR